MNAAALRARHVLVAVSLAALLALAITLAAPVAAQEETTAQSQAATRGKDVPGKQEQPVQGSGQQAEEVAQEDEQAAGRATKSLQRAEALIIEDDADEDQAVDSIEIEVAGCEVEEKGATVTVEDDSNTPATFTNAPDTAATGADEVEATLEAIGDQVIVEVADGADLPRGFGSEDANENGTVSSFAGITCERDDEGSGVGNQSGDGNEEANEASDQNSSDDGSCAGAEVVERLSGTGDQQSPRFRTTGESFRVTSEVEATNDLVVYSITVYDENGDFVTSIDQEEEGTSASFVNADAGTYYLDVISANTNYTITVEDCVGGNVVNNPGGNLPNTGGLSLIGVAVLGLVSAAAGLSVIRGGRR